MIFNGKDDISVNLGSKSVYSGIFLIQSESDIEAQRDKLKPIGPLVKTQHRVKGQVYTLNDNVIVIENFVYDGRGFGVHVNVGESGFIGNVNPKVF